MSGRGGALRGLLLVGALSTGACDDVIIETPRGVSITSVYCTCACTGQEVPRFEMCIRPDQAPAPGQSFTRRQVIEICGQACRATVQPLGQEAACVSGRLDCGRAGCPGVISCDVVDDATTGFFVPAVADGGVVLPDGGLVGPGYDPGCLEVEPSSSGEAALAQCPDVGCDIEQFFEPVCGNGVLEPGEACDAPPCGVFPRTCDGLPGKYVGGQYVLFRGVPGCSDDCSRLLPEACVAVPASDPGPPTEQPVCPGEMDRMFHYLRECTVIGKERSLASCGPAPPSGARPTAPLCMAPGPIQAGPSVLRAE